MALPARLSVVTVGARDLDALKQFYVGLGWPLAFDIPGEIAAFRLRGAVLSLFGIDDLVADAQLSGPRAEPPTGFRGLSLAVNVDLRAEVDAAIEAARAAGARVVKEPVDADWGGRSAYFADPEENLWEVAWVPPESAMAAALRDATGAPGDG